MYLPLTNHAEALKSSDRLIPPVALDAKEMPLSHRSSQARRPSQTPRSLDGLTDVHGPFGKHRERLKLLACADANQDIFRFDCVFW